MINVDADFIQLQIEDAEAQLTAFIARKALSDHNYVKQKDNAIKKIAELKEQKEKLLAQKSE